MLDLYAEFRAVVSALEKGRIEYALCGGLAVSIYSEPRATQDMDFMILAHDLNDIIAIARGLGFDIQHPPMEFAGGRVVIRRLTKVEATDHMVMDLLLADSEPLKGIFQSREHLEWEGLPLWIVNRAGLIELKRLRNSAQDRADIEKLEGLS